MLFNSYVFLFVFLPLLFLLYAILVRSRYGRAPLWLLLAGSCVYYAWWDIRFFGLLAGMIVLNLALSRILTRRERTRKLWLVIGVAVNLTPLLVFKYADFMIGSVNTAAGTQFPLWGLVLPIGISFFTFQQIAYLVDVYRRLTEPHDFLEYALFVSFFPQLIAGPIVHHKDFISQIREAVSKITLANVNVAATLFVVGLFKKVVLADQLSTIASPLFRQAELYQVLNIYEAWTGALAYTFQIYFDFSAYTDMALALGFLFGFRLPINFYSPYKSLNIIEFWRRWHISLSSFLRDYIYFPLGGGRVRIDRKFLNILVTMLIGGIWHGAGWTFLIWGLVHGLAISANHLWRHLWKERGGWAGRACAHVITFIFLIFTWVIFNSPSFSGAWHYWSEMVPLGGLTVPTEWAGTLQSWGISATAHGDYHSTPLAILLAAGVVVFTLPNTMQLFPGLYIDHGKLCPGPSRLSWRPSFGWLGFTAGLFLVTIWNMTTVSEFLYYQF
jgi:D-alanyl-lipoteichoic acid acyltransferase DltB (MBOAT superfamily)